MKVIILALLVCATFATFSKPVSHFVDTKTVLAEIDKDYFGNTFISAIQMNLATESPVEEITLLIDEIINEIKTQQGAADEKNRTDQTVCDESIANFNQQIHEQTQTIATLEKSIADNQEILAQAKIDLEQTIRDYDETVDQIVKGTAQREAEHARWAEEDYQMQIDIATLEEGVKLINHMIHGVVFSQIQSRYEKVVEKLRENKSRHASLFKPLITSLTQLATKLNYENVMKILELLNNIRNGIVQEREVARQQEEKAQADWVERLAHLEQQKQSLADKRVRLTALIESTEVLLVQLNASLEQHRIELENAQTLLAAQTATCDAQSHEYLTSSSERKREIDILQKLLDHINEKFAAVGEYIASRE